MWLSSLRWREEFLPTILTSQDHINRTGKSPEYIAVDPNSDIYVANSGSGTVSAIDETTHHADTKSIGKSPRHFASPNLIL